MATEVSIVSNASLRLGGEPISSFDEADLSGSNIERSRLASNLWPTVRRSILRAHPWNVATARVLLSPDATAPAFGYSARFLRPIDWLRTLGVGNDTRDRIPYRTEGRYYLANESAFPLTYIFDNKDPETYDASLVEAMELGVALALAYPFTKSASMRESIAAELRESLRSARANDGMDDPAETFGDSILLASRLSGGGPGLADGFGNFR